MKESSPRIDASDCQSPGVKVDETSCGATLTIFKSSAHRGASVQKRADKVLGDYHKTAKRPDAKIRTHADATGPVEMNPYNSGRVSGFVVGLIS